MAESVTIRDGGLVEVTSSGSLLVSRCIVIEAGAELKLKNSASLVMAECIVVESGGITTIQRGTVRLID